MNEEEIKKDEDRISKNFKLSEFIESETAKKKGIDNLPSEEIVENIKLLVNTVLQPLRDCISYPFHINSGYRCKELNKAVGGSKTSAHLKGLAADVDLGSKQLNKILWEEIDRHPEITYDQYISEYGHTWIHIGIKPNNVGNRKAKFKIH